MTSRLSATLLLGTVIAVGAAFFLNGSVVPQAFAEGADMSSHHSTDIVEDNQASFGYAVLSHEMNFIYGTKQDVSKARANAGGQQPKLWFRNGSTEYIGTSTSLFSSLIAAQSPLKAAYEKKQILDDEQASLSGELEGLSAEQLDVRRQGPEQGSSSDTVEQQNQIARRRASISERITALQPHINAANPWCPLGGVNFKFG